jgi:hypothetical protein
MLINHIKKPLAFQKLMVLYFSIYNEFTKAGHKMSILFSRAPYSKGLPRAIIYDFSTQSVMPPTKASRV